MPSAAQPNPRDYAREVARVLDGIMEDRGLSRRQIIPRAGFSQPLFSQYVKGVKAIRVDEVDRLCEVLEVSTMRIWVEAERRLVGRPSNVVNFPGNPGLSPATSNVRENEESQRAAMSYDPSEELEGHEEQP